MISVQIPESFFLILHPVIQAVHFEPYIQITRQQPKHEKHERSDSMSPIHFSLPTQVFLETDAVAHHAALFARGKKAMIVTGRTSAKRNGAQDDVVAALEQPRHRDVL